MYDNSQLAVYQKCPMSYYFQYVLGLQLSNNEDRQDAMYFGEVVHKYLENLYTDISKNNDKFFEDYKEPADSDDKTRDMLKLVCKTYSDKYLKEDSYFDFLSVEKVDIFKLDGYDFAVKNDGIFKSNKDFFGIEHKTTKSIAYNYFEKFMYSAQIDAQIYNVTKQYGKCNGVLVNAIEYKTFKRKPSGVYDALQEFDGGYKAVKLNRSFTNRTKNQLSDWKDNAIVCIENIERSKVENSWCKNKSAMGGSSCLNCDYNKICINSRGNKFDEDVAEIFYTKVDPFAYLTSKKENIDENKH